MWFGGRADAAANVCCTLMIGLALEADAAAFGCARLPLPHCPFLDLWADAAAFGGIAFGRGGIAFGRAK